MGSSKGVRACMSRAHLLLHSLLHSMCLRQSLKFMSCTQSGSLVAQCACVLMSASTSAAGSEPVKTKPTLSDIHRSAERCVNTDMYSVYLLPAGDPDMSQSTV